MNGNTSLEHFFAQTDAVTLNNCDQEAIHRSGAIQNIGALLVVEPETEQIIGASENATALLDIEMDALLRSSLSQIDPELAQLARETTEEAHILHEALEFDVEREGVAYDTVVHTHAGQQIIEFVPNSLNSTTVTRRKMRECSKACARILHAADFDEALAMAVDAAQKISGYCRAKIYKFQPDWAGEVVAESNDGTLPSYMGLCFPEGDIPQQAREIMRIVPFRSIGTSSDGIVPIRVRNGKAQDLDLTWSVLRSVSTMHTQYLRNIGVEAAFSCSLMYQDQLWGLIAVHHTAADPVPFDSWTLLQEIGAALMLRYAQQQRTDTANMLSQLRNIESDFAAALRESGDVVDVIGSLMPVLQDFLGADGFAFQFGNSLHLSGRTPPREFLSEMVQWAMKRRETSDQFQTNALHLEWDKAKDHIDTCCGVLLQPVAVHRMCQLIWFRGPITRTVHWAGRPEKEKDGPVLGPRNSFDTWVQQHKDKSAPWREGQLESARQVFTQFLDIIATQMLLKEENDSLRQFAATAAHDLKAPLLGLNTALEWMSEDNFDPASIKEMHAIAQQSTNRMADLTEGLLELAVLEEQSIMSDPVDVAQLIEDVQHLLVHQISQSGATISVSTLPPVIGTGRLFLRLFLNLVSNAIKYRKVGCPPEIYISEFAVDVGLVGIAVTDNGQGVEARYAEHIFQPLSRLQSKSEVEGTGLGLTICQRIVAAHGGEIRLDEDFVDGARFLITLPQPQEPAA